MAAMRLEQVQRFILAKKIFWGYRHLSLLLTIYESISETHASILAMEPACSAGVGLNERYS